MARSLAGCNPSRGRGPDYLGPSSRPSGRRDDRDRIFYTYKYSGPTGERRLFYRMGSRWNYPSPGEHDPLLHITAIERQFVGNLLIRYIQAHEIEAQHPDFQRLMMARKNGVGQIIKAGIAGVALIALACRFRVIKATLDNLGGPTRWTRNAV